MALAIELAASRYPTLGLDGLEAGLHERLRLLDVGGSAAAGRHRSIRDTISWSYSLLDPTKQALLRGISVFASWFDVDAGQAIAAPDIDRAVVADGLARLADHSLLVVERGAPTRYRVPCTIRDYGEEQLELAGELATVQARHDQWCRARLAELAAAPPDDAWCDRFDDLVDDARAALLRCAGDPGRAGPAAATRGSARRPAVPPRAAHRGTAAIPAGRRPRPLTDRTSGAAAAGGRCSGHPLRRHGDDAVAPVGRGHGDVGGRPWRRRPRPGLGVAVHHPVPGHDDGGPGSR